jgi:cell division transport system permease protein
MHLSTFGFLIEEAGKNIRRNGLMSVAAITTVTISMAILGGVLYSMFRLHQIASSFPRQFEILVFMKTNATRDQTLALKRKIEKMNGVEHVKLFTREQAWAEMQQKDKENSTSIASELQANPLPDRLDIRMKDPEFIHPMAVLLENTKNCPEIDTVKEDRETLNRVIATSRLITNIGAAAGLILLIATAFVIQNTIRLTVYARRREIRIMQLVGATANFIRFPLVLEGILYGILGSLVASALILFSAQQVSRYATSFETPIAQYLPPAINPWIVLFYMLSAGILIGCAGVFLSIRRFLKIH